jgi:serine/threonine protein kinase
VVVSGQAPELVTYEHGITFAVDIYSFGVMMHEVITGDPPDKRRGTLTVPR